jgi:formylglycine-generating enzyme required for sulfatase activity
MRALTANSPVFDLAVPAGLLCLLLGIVSVQLGVFSLPQASADIPETIVIAAAPYTYRAVGDFQQNGIPVDGPLVNLEPAPQLEIMRYQVTASAYGRCVEAGACQAAKPNLRTSGEVPVTGVSFEDASQYAHWLTVVTGETWRLPTVAEWDFAAGARAADHVVQAETNAANPADRWLAFYEQESAAKVDVDPMPQTPGFFGFNENGLADVAANVWEWTSTCAQRTTLDGGGQVATLVETCGLRYLEGRHRTPMNIFVRDARGGGCSVGVPPANLGFRLVREAPWYAAMVSALGTN